MESKDIQFGNITLSVYEDGRIYRKPFQGTDGRQMKGQWLSQNQSGLGYANDDGYMTVHISIHGKGKRLSVARLVASCFLPNPYFLSDVNHIDGNKKNNHRDNLEWCSHGDNMRSFRRAHGVSKFRGVSRSKAATRPWKSEIKSKGVYKHLGCFKTQEEAAMAWNEAALEMGYDKSALNVID